MTSPLVGSFRLGTLLLVRMPAARGRLGTGPFVVVVLFVAFTRAQKRWSGDDEEGSVSESPGCPLPECDRGKEFNKCPAHTPVLPTLPVQGGRVLWTGLLKSFRHFPRWHMGSFWRPWGVGGGLEGTWGQ